MWFSLKLKVCSGKIQFLFSFTEKKKENCWLKSLHPSAKLFHVSKWLRYFVLGWHNRTLHQVHGNYNTISSRHHSLHCSLPLDALFCDTLLSSSESVLQRICRLTLEYKPQRRKTTKDTWITIFGQHRHLRYTHCIQLKLSLSKQQEFDSKSKTSTFWYFWIKFLRSQASIHDNN